MHNTDYRGCKITRHKDGKWEAHCEDLLGVGVSNKASRDNEADIHAFVDGMYEQAEKKLATLNDLAAKVKEDQTALDTILLSAKDIGQKAIAKARQIGNYIKEARSLITKGQWMKWLENETGLQYQTARKYIKIAEVAPKHLEECSSLMDAYYYLGLDKPRTNRAKKKPKTEDKDTNSSGSNDTNSSGNNDTNSGGSNDDTNSSGSNDNDTNGNHLLEAAEKAEKLDALSIKALVATLLDKFEHLETDEELDDGYIHLNKLLDLFRTEDLIETILFRANAADFESIKDDLLPVVKWYNDNKPKKTKKEKKEAILTE